MTNCIINHKKNFLLNTQPTFFKIKTLKFLFKNVVTGGVYGIVKNLSSNYEIKALKNENKILQKNIQTIGELFNTEITHLKQQSLSEEGICLLYQRCVNLSKQELLAFEQMPSPSKLMTVIFVIKNVLFNCLTVGVYGTYQAHLLSKKLINYRAKNKFLKEQQIRTTQEQMNFLQVLMENHKLQATDQGKLNQENQQLKQQLIKQKRLEEKKLLAHTQQAKDAKEISTLKYQTESLIREKQKLETDNSVQSQQIERLRKNLERLAEEVSQRHVDQKELDKLKKLENLPAIEQLISRLGSFDVPYSKRPEDGEIPGAFGIDEAVETSAHPWSDFAKRYNDLKTAEEVISQSFDFIAKSIFNQEKTKEKYLITNSYLTKDTPGFHVIYRFMALDLLKGAKIQSRGCQGGYELKINNFDVIMLPSCPEKVLRLLPNRNHTPQLATRYLQKDDFTPHESIGPATDPLSAKWILAQLTTQEQFYLETLLALPIMEKTHSDQQQLAAFLQSKNPQVALVKTACDLIMDLAGAFKNQFGKTLIMRQWQHLIAQRIISEENEEVYVSSVDEGCLIEKNKNDKQDPFVEWVIQPPLSKSKSNFFEAFQFSMLRYQSVLKNLTRDHLLHVLNPNEKIANLKLDAISKFYYTSHNMLEEYGKNQHCLFSNLLTILMSDREQVNADNVLALKREMARYLDVYPDQFKEKIQSTHGCSIKNYISWLREEENYPFIRLDHLSPLEIEIAAFTFGIRIAVFPLNLERQVIKGIEGEQGRVMPEKNYYEPWVGPRTKELLIIGNTFGDSSKPGSYYGMFPRLNLAKITDNELLENAKQIMNYWEEMDQWQRGF